MSDSDDMRRFGAFSFIGDRLPVIAIAIVFMALVDLVIVATTQSFQLLILICCLQIIGGLAIIGWLYMREQRFWRQAESVVVNLEKCNQLASFLDEPKFLEGKLANQLAEHIAQVANDEALALSTDMFNLRQYTELWVHEIKAPIAASKLILSEMHGTQATKLKLELERMESLVEQALFAARSTNLANDYLIRDVNLLNLVRDVCKNNMNFLVAKGVSLDLEIDESLQVLTDKTWISFVLSQLIMNSAKYGSKTLRFSAREIMPNTPEGCVELEIEDDGCGIPASDMPRVFDRGFTGEVGRKNGAATGMGLYLAAVMCGQMGVGITLGSEEGKGTRVILAFPQDRKRM